MAHGRALNILCSNSSLSKAGLDGIAQILNFIGEQMAVHSLPASSDIFFFTKQLILPGYAAEKSQRILVA